MAKRIKRLHLLVDNSVDEFARMCAVDTIERTFNLELELAPLEVDLRIAYSSHRGQYDAEKLLGILASAITDSLFMAILCRDIFVSGLNFVFGVALPYKGCIMSTWRLRNSDQNLYYARISKTVKHELGHVFGLSHCSRRCVMVFANSLLELDLKFDDFCSKCKQYLLGINILRKPGNAVV